jgi:hypothetical protein
MVRRNMRLSFVGEPCPESDAQNNLDVGNDEVELSVKSGRVVFVVPSGTPDDQVTENPKFTIGELELENGMVLTFWVCGSATGADIGVVPGSDR